MKFVLVAAVISVASTSAFAATVAHSRLDNGHDLSPLYVAKMAPLNPPVLEQEGDSLLTELWAYVEGSLSPEPREKAWATLMQAVMGAN